MSLRRPSLILWGPPREEDRSKELRYKKAKIPPLYEDKPTGVAAILQDLGSLVMYCLYLELLTSWMGIFRVVPHTLLISYVLHFKVYQHIRDMAGEDYSDKECMLFRLPDEVLEVIVKELHAEAQTDIRDRLALGLKYRGAEDALIGLDSLSQSCQRLRHMCLPIMYKLIDAGSKHTQVFMAIAMNPTLAAHVQELSLHDIDMDIIKKRAKSRPDLLIGIKHILYIYGMLDPAAGVSNELVQVLPYSPPPVPKPKPSELVYYPDPWDGSDSSDPDLPRERKPRRTPEVRPKPRPNPKPQRKKELYAPPPVFKKKFEVDLDHPEMPHVFNTALFMLCANIEVLHIDTHLQLPKVRSQPVFEKLHTIDIFLGNLSNTPGRLLDPNSWIYDAAPNLVTFTARQTTNSLEMVLLNWPKVKTFDLRYTKLDTVSAEAILTNATQLESFTYGASGQFPSLPTVVSPRTMGELLGLRNDSLKKLRLMWDAHEKRCGCFGDRNSNLRTLKHMDKLEELEIGLHGLNVANPKDWEETLTPVSFYRAFFPPNLRRLTLWDGLRTWDIGNLARAIPSTMPLLREIRIIPGSVTKRLSQQAIDDLFGSYGISFSYVGQGREIHDEFDKPLDAFCHRFWDFWCGLYEPGFPQWQIDSARRKLKLPDRFEYDVVPRDSKELDKEYHEYAEGALDSLIPEEDNSSWQIFAITILVEALKALMCISHK